MSESVAELVVAGRIDDAFAALHTACASDVDRFIGARVANATRRKDLTQDIWAAVYQSLPRFRGDSKARTWLLAIAYHKLTKAHGTTSFDELDSAVDAVALLSRPTTPTGVLDREARARALQKVMRSLSPEDRDVLEQRFVVGLKPAEIIEVMGLRVSPNTLSQRIVRLVRRLHSALASDEAVAP